MAAVKVIGLLATCIVVGIGLLVLHTWIMAWIADKWGNRNKGKENEDKGVE